MSDFILQLSPLTQALIATLFTWGVTGTGAALVFFTRTINQKFMDATLGGAIALAIGIGIQNFPEGTAVAIPLRREGMSKGKSFFIGQASGIVEPIAGVIGAIFVMKMQNILPYALCFAAGAMIFVVVEELIPESQKKHENIDTVTMATMVGFSVMMILDVALG